MCDCRRLVLRVDSGVFIIGNQPPRLFQFSVIDVSVVVCTQLIVPPVSAEVDLSGQGGSLEHKHFW